MKSLSIKNVPNEVIERLRSRAQRNHRSLQGEVLSILEKEAHQLSVAEFIEAAKRRNFGTPSESVAIIRADRDSR